MSQLTLSFLGPPQIERDGKPVKLGRRKATALLAYLVVTQQAHSRDTLATLLWPQQDQGRARANLRNALLTLNRALGAGWLQQDREMITFAPTESGWVDVGQFQQLADCTDDGACLHSLEDAVELYRADFMAGFTLRDSADYDDWQRLETERLRLVLTGTLERLVSGHLQHGASDSALIYARRWVACDPLDEQAQQQLIHLYALVGQTAAALRQYHDYVDLLAAELGVPPTEAVTALYEQVKTGVAGPQQSGADVTTTPFSNLPPQPTAFIGREAEIDQISDLLNQPDCRLLTLVGPGGAGKTRLAVEVAGRIESRFGDGVVVVPLGAQTAPDHMLHTIASVFGSLLANQNHPETALLNYLRDKSLLLVLDNVEHLVSGAGALSRILDETPVKLLATSRERLHLQEEWLFEVGGMRYPLIDEASDESYSAVQLFEQTARQVQPDFTADRASITRICKLVDGLPLGIVLAASWTRLLTCDDIEGEIEGGIGFLETTLQNVPARHRSIHAVLDHSWALLTEVEQVAFARLAVFRGGFGREAAEQVAGVSLYTLMSLTDKSLIQRGPAGRYDLHNLLRQYAADKLGPAQPALQSDHATYYAHFIAGRSDDTPQSLDEIETEFENIQAGWQVAIQQMALPAIDRLVQGLWHYYMARSWYRAQDEANYRATLDILGNQRSETAAWIYESLGRIRSLRGDYEESVSFYQAALRHVPARDRLWRARLLRKQGDVRQLQHEFDSARLLYQEAEDTLRAESDDPAWWREWLMIQLERMMLYYWLGDWQAIAAIGESIADAVEEYAAPAQKLRYLSAMGMMIYRRNRYTNLDEAIHFAQTALTIALESGNTADIAWLRFGLGFTHLWNGGLQEAEDSLHASLAMTERSGDIVLQSRCLTYLTVTYRKLRRFDLVRDYAAHSQQVATAANMPEYVGTAHANQAWLAWCDGELEAVEQQGRLAFQCWSQLGEGHASLTFWWTVRFPLMAVAMERGQLEQAIDHARVIVESTQQKLADPLTAALEQAALAWENADRDSAQTQLEDALRLAQTFAYL